MQWAVSEKMLENMILSDKWTTMSESDIEVFLTTPGMSVVEAKGTIQESNGSVPVDLKSTHASNPDIECIADVAGPEEQNIPGDLVGDPFDFFEKVESYDEFIIHSDTINYEDSRYDHVYMDCFSDDSFF